MKREMQACLLGSLLVVGCSNPEPRPHDMHAAVGSTRPGAGTSPASRLPAVAASRPGRPAEQRAATSTVRPNWQPTRVAQTTPARQPAVGKPAIVMVSHEEPAVATAVGPTLTVPDQSAPLPQPLAVAPAALVTPAATVAPPPAQVQIGFARAEDYSWLHGQAQFIRSSRTWRLRYADLGQEDLHGGSVTLTPESQLDGLRDGQYVLVRGRLLNPESRGLAPAYRVDTLQLGPMRP
jgi:hypothetical protein